MRPMTTSLCSNAFWKSPLEYISLGSRFKILSTKIGFEFFFIEFCHIDSSCGSLDRSQSITRINEASHLKSMSSICSVIASVGEVLPVGLEKSSIGTGTFVSL